MATRGHPDWGVPRASPLSAVGVDIGELAARLGSIVRYDRSGQVLLADGFENGLVGWTSIVGGLGAAVAVDTTRARSGGQCIKLTGGSDGTRIAMIRKNIPLVTVGSTGFEFSFETVDDFDYIECEVHTFDDTQEALARFRWTETTLTWQYVNAAGSLVNMTPTYDIGLGTKGFNTCKLVADLANGVYTRFKINERTYDLAGIPLRTIAGGDPPRIEAYVAIHSNAAVNSIVYVDDAIFTVGES